MPDEIARAYLKDQKYQDIRSIKHVTMSELQNCPYADAMQVNSDRGSHVKIHVDPV